MPELKMTYIGGPTALFEIGGLRLLTDPTFDATGSEYPTSLYTLKKLMRPALDAGAVGAIDAVLLSHEHHFENLDRAGKQMLSGATTVLTTVAGAQRLGANAVGLNAWESREIAQPGGPTWRITATQARHGPIGGDRGPVIGFVISSTDRPDDCLYISGDTVWYEGVAEVARRFRVTAAVLFMGAAVVSAVGPAHLTMTAEEGVEAARVFGEALIIPLHFEGWAHFTESQDQVNLAFVAAGLQHRLRWLKPGIPETIERAR